MPTRNNDQSPVTWYQYHVGGRSVKGSNRGLLWNIFDQETSGVQRERGAHVGDLKSWRLTAASRKGVVPFTAAAIIAWSHTKSRVLSLTPQNVYGHQHNLEPSLHNLLNQYDTTRRNCNTGVCSLCETSTSAELVIRTSTGYILPGTAQAPVSCHCTK